MFAAEVLRQGVDLAVDREQMQEQRDVRFELAVECANPRRDEVRAFKRRPQIERRAEKLHEYSVRNPVGVGAASGPQNREIAAVSEGQLQLVQQTALPRTSFADNTDHGS